MFKTHYDIPKKYRFRQMLLIMLIGLFLLSACGTSNDQLTLVANHNIANTQMVDIRASATVVRARMQITLDFAGTRAIEVEQQGQFLRSTLVSLGTESAFINNNLPLPGNFPTFTPQPTSPVNVPITPAPQPQVTEELNAEGTLVQVTLPATEASTEARFENIVLSSGVNDNDCAVNTNPRFTPTSTEIYIVATAYDVPTNATITSIWQSQGTEVALFSFDTQSAINGNCIWFFIDQNDAEFVVGTWSVELWIDDVVASPPIPFQILEG
jgi:hypothetical protein